MTKDQIHAWLERFGKKIGLNLPYFVKNGFWMLLKQGFSMLSGLGILIIFTRFTSQETLGQYQFLIAVISMFVVFSINEMNNSILMGAANNKDGAYKKALKIRFFWAFSAIPIIALFAGYYFYFKEDILLAIGILLIATLYPFLTAPDSWPSFLLGKKRFDLITRYSSIRSILIFAAVSISIISSDGHLIPIISAYLGTTILTNLYFAKKTFKLIKNDRKEKDWKSYGYFLTAVSIFPSITGKLDYVLIGIFLGPKELAIYAIGAKFALMFKDVMKTLLTTTTPIIAKINTLSLKKYLQVFAGTALVAVALIFVMPWLVPMLFTTQYSDSIYLSQIILAFLPFYVINNIYNKHFRLYLKNRSALTLLNIVYPLIRIGVMAILLYLYQIEGMALSHGILSITNLILLLIFTYFILSAKGKSSKRSTASSDDSVAMTSPMDYLQT